MAETNDTTLHVIDASQVPSLKLDKNQCILQAEHAVLSVGDRLEVATAKNPLTITSLALLLGKQVPVTATEYGHRYLVTFDAPGLPNDRSTSFSFEKVDPSL